MALRYRAMGALAKGLTMGVFGLWMIGTVVWHATIWVMKDSCLAGEVLPKRLLPRQYVEGTAFMPPITAIDKATAPATVEAALCFILPQAEKPSFHSAAYTGGDPKIFFKV